MNSSETFQRIHSHRKPKVSTPAKPSSINETWIWDMEYRAIAQIPSLKDNSTLVLKVPEDGVLTICSQSLYPIPEYNISVERGPELIISREGVYHRIWTNVWAAAMNGTLLHPEMSDFEIFNPSNIFTNFCSMRIFCGRFSSRFGAHNLGF